MTGASSWLYLHTYHHDRLKTSKLKWSKLRPHIQAAGRPSMIALHLMPVPCVSPRKQTANFKKESKSKTVPFSLWLSACEVRIKLRKVSVWRPHQIDSAVSQVGLLEPPPFNGFNFKTLLLIERGLRQSKSRTPAHSLNNKVPRHQKLQRNRYTSLVSYTR